MLTRLTWFPLSNSKTLTTAYATACTNPPLNSDAVTLTAKINQHQSCTSPCQFEFQKIMWPSKNSKANTATKLRTTRFCVVAIVCMAQAAVGGKCPECAVDFTTALLPRGMHMGQGQCQFGLTGAATTNTKGLQRHNNGIGNSAAVTNGYVIPSDECSIDLVFAVEADDRGSDEVSGPLLSTYRGCSHTGTGMSVDFRGSASKQGAVDPSLHGNEHLRIMRRKQPVQGPSWEAKRNSYDKVCSTD